ncbi:hypothetical protein CA13_00020 [Planctomycetes bacterium CA13]|uniref:Uncharacterized protein n=2 Tax=Novipirellula herctigrandis TaxID=2527986 RepID=A0A5C5YV31_9BACT|nr:hypothetical protein CA13_00020 [Planctomycetes bacterium CA13]
MTDTPRHKGHVVSKCLYPSTTPGDIQRPTVPECENCQTLWTDAETQFRNILVLAGEQNHATKETWETMQRSFTKPSGKRWVQDIFESMTEVSADDGARYMVHPHKDARVNLVLRKIVRGLSAYHNLRDCVPDDHVWVGIPPANFPDEFMRYDLGAGFFQYGIALFETDLGIDADSGWLMRFYGTREFIGVVANSAEKKLEIASHFDAS